MQRIAQDFWRFGALLSVAAAIGFADNYLRQDSLSLVYRSKASRLEQQVQIVTRDARPENSTAPAAAANASVTILSLEQFQRYAQGGEALILDARPEIFYSLGHVPGALSLPRDHFDSAYLRLKPQLEKDRARPLAVYCSDFDCEDSELVANALLKLGHTRVLRFKGGWAAWQGAHLPEEKAVQP